MTAPIEIFPVLYDLETSGVDIRTAQIVQIAAVTAEFNDGLAKPRTLFSSLVNPGIPIPAEASEIHGIYDNDVVYSPGQVTALMTFAMILENLSQKYHVILIGHNILRYDNPIIQRILPGFFEEYDTLDTYVFAMRNFSDKGQKLTEVYEHFCGFKAVNAHDAAADCNFCAHIVARMLKTTGLSLYELTESLVDPVVLEVMPFGKYKGKPMKEVPKSYLAWIRTNFTEPAADIEATICHYLGECNG